MAVPVTSQDLCALDRRIYQALSRDRSRLIRAAAVAAKPDATDTHRRHFEQLLAQSLAAVQSRRNALPEPRLNSELPIYAHADKLVELIQSEQVIIVAGETGSGKTTQLPQLCLAAGRGQTGMIGCTQPRRIAARSVAKRVADELQVSLGSFVGYQVRFEERVQETTGIKFMTDGILLAELQTDRWFSAYDTIIIDEAHERSLNIDFLLGYLKGLLRRRPDLKLIVTSATIDTQRFSEHFNNAPVVNVEGRGYPVELRYRGPAEGKAEDDVDINEAIARCCDEFFAEHRGADGGDVLVFLPGEREIREAHHHLQKRKFRHVAILPLYARLSAKDQDQVFSPSAQRRIVLATNVAETSLTVPRIACVIDTGVARVKRYSPRSKMDRLHIEPISQASADQRKGRCGRVRSGICFRLYADVDFQTRAEFTDPEIHRSSLAGVVLRMLWLRLGHIEEFPFIDPPDSRSVKDGWQLLSELGAVGAARQLSDLGREMAQLSIDVKLARILVESKRRGCLKEALTICSFLGTQDPRERPADARQAADEAHAKLADERSEFVGFLKLWAAYLKAREELSQSKLRDWCRQEFLSYMRMREWHDLHRQLNLQSQGLKWTSNSQPAEYDQLHRALITAFSCEIGRKSERGIYEGPRGRKYQIFPGSTLFKSPPAWMVSAQILDTQKVWAMCNAKIEPQWVVDCLPHLLSRKSFDPHWSRKQGKVIAHEQISLFGLVLIAKSPVHFGAQDPAAAREIMIREGLVTGEVNTRCAFLARNMTTLEAALEQEAKLRRVGIIADEDWQVAWYLDRLPADVCSVSGLEKWYQRLPAEQRAKLEWKESDLIVDEDSSIDAFPDFLKVGSLRLKLKYHFAPGADDDGVSLEVPIHVLGALDSARLSWLVPGLVQEKTTALIKSLPKSLRKNFVPAPDFAKAFISAYPAADVDSLESALARYLKKATGCQISAVDFDSMQLPPHLNFLLVLLDDAGRELARGRKLEELTQRYSVEAQKAFADRAGEHIQQSGLEDFPEGGVADSISTEAGLVAFPALALAEGVLAVDVFSDRSSADRAHREAVVELIRRKLEANTRKIKKQLPLDSRIELAYAATNALGTLADELSSAAFLQLASPDAAHIRTAEQFNARIESIRKGHFSAAIELLKVLEEVLALSIEVRAELESNLIGWAAENLSDARRHLDELLVPGFLAQTGAENLTEMPRYLRALKTRVSRAKLDPAKDQQKMLELKVFDDALQKARNTGLINQPPWQQLRWDLEEFRVSLFAQELGTKRTVSAKRLAKQIEKLT